MNIHEYQAKEILRANGIPVPPGEVATTPDEAVSIAEQYGGTVVVKAQVHSGGRGKAGGVKLATTTAEVRAHAEAILGMTISDLTVEKVLITPAEDIDTEAYVGILVDRKAQAATFMVSAEGGIDTRPPRSWCRLKAGSTSRKSRTPTRMPSGSSRSIPAMAS